MTRKKTSRLTEMVAAAPVAPAVVPTGEFRLVHASCVAESKTNPRKTFDQDSLLELTESVRAHGVLQPLLVRPDPRDGEMFELVAGARRLRAACAAGLVQVPVIVQQLDDRQALEVQVLENLQRADLHPLEEANGYQRLNEGHGYSVEQIAAKLGKSKAYVYGRMALLRLAPSVQKLFLAGKLDASRALLVARIPVPELQEKAAIEITDEDEWTEPMGYREAVRLVQRDYSCHLKGAPFDPKKADLVPEAGPCTTCPKRTGNQRDLFGPVAGEDRADVCTDPTCFAKKREAQFARKAAEVEAKGGRVLPMPKYQHQSSFGHGSEYVSPGDCCWDDPKQRTWKQLCSGDHEPRPVLGRGARGVTEIRWSAKEARAAAEANGHKLRSHASPAKTGEDPRERAHKQRCKAIAAAVPEVVLGAQSSDEHKLLSFVARRLLDRGYSDAWKTTAARRGWNHVKQGLNGALRKEIEKAINAMTVGELRGLLVEVLACDNPTSLWSTTPFSDGWKEACELAGVDMKPHLAAAKAAAKKGQAKKRTAARR